MMTLPLPSQSPSQAGAAAAERSDDESQQQTERMERIVGPLRSVGTARDRVDGSS